MTITFCGHADFCGNESFEEKIISVLREKMPDEIFLGGYGAFDGFAYNCAQKYKKSEAPSLRICLITPYLDAEHKKGLARDVEYDEIIYPPLENVPPRFAISRRNEWMVDNADCLIAFVERSFGGAYKTLKYAEKRKREIINIAQIGEICR